MHGSKNNYGTWVKLVRFVRETNKMITKVLIHLPLEQKIKKNSLFSSFRASVMYYLTRLWLIKIRKIKTMNKQIKR